MPRRHRARREDFAQRNRAILAQLRDVERNPCELSLASEKSLARILRNRSRAKARSALGCSSAAGELSCRELGRDCFAMVFSPRKSRANLGL